MHVVDCIKVTDNVVYMTKQWLKFVTSQTKIATFFSFSIEGIKLNVWIKFLLLIIIIPLTDYAIWPVPISEFIWNYEPYR
jgi:hypothetical protein